MRSFWRKRVRVFWKKMDRIVNQLNKNFTIWKTFEKEKTGKKAEREEKWEKVSAKRAFIYTNKSQKHTAKCAWMLYNHCTDWTICKLFLLCIGSKINLCIVFFVLLPCVNCTKQCAVHRVCSNGGMPITAKAFWRQTLSCGCGGLHGIQLLCALPVWKAGRLVPSPSR